MLQKLLVDRSPIATLRTPVLSARPVFKWHPYPEASVYQVAVTAAGGLEQSRTSPRPSHLLAGVLLALAGVRQEADDKLQALASENPESGLLGRLRGTMGTALVRTPQSEGGVD